jgi:2-polyprenyl-6-hydroxyphenyl methylase/3-demethylubiquinone-9 3-methyltransferase
VNLRWRIAQFFEIRWWQRYLARRDKTTYLAWKRRYWENFLQKSGLEIPPDVSVLDAGCGPAGIFIILENQMTDALDSLLERYEISFPHFRRSDYPQVRFFSQALETFGSTIDSVGVTVSHPDTYSYDIVFCLNALNHVADLPRCLDRLAALTKPGGTLAVSIDAHNYAWLKRLFRLAPADILHPHQYDLEEYQAMLTIRGFQIEKSVLIKKGAIFNYCLLVAITQPM